MSHQGLSAAQAAMLNAAGNGTPQAQPAQQAVQQGAQGQGSGLRGALVGGGLGYILGMLLEARAENEERRRVAAEQAEAQRIAQHTQTGYDRMREKAQNRKIFRPGEGWVER